jgi:hypothetical protein
MELQWPVFPRPQIPSHALSNGQLTEIGRTLQADFGRCCLPREHIDRPRSCTESVGIQTSGYVRDTDQGAAACETAYCASSIFGI